MTVKQLTAPTTIRIEPELKVWLLQKAHIEKRNLSNLINYLLDQSKQEEEGYIEISRGACLPPERIPIKKNG